MPNIVSEAPRKAAEVLGIPSSSWTVEGLMRAESRRGRGSIEVSPTPLSDLELLYGLVEE
jgi:hypothetical protein